MQGAIGTCLGTPSDPGDQNDSFTQGLVMPLTRGDLYARVSYDLTPTTEIYATLNYGVSRTQNTPAQGNSDKSGMNMQVRQSLSAADRPVSEHRGLSHRLSRRPFHQHAWFDWANIPTDQLMFLLRTKRRFVVGGDGTFDLFGKTWSWDSYFQHGETDTSIKIYNMPLSGAPVDAVATAGQQRRRRFVQTPTSRASTWRRMRCSTRPARSSAATPSPSPLAACPSIPSAAP